MKVFYFDTGYDTEGEVHVEAINDPNAKILDHNGPYRCGIIPNDPLLPTETVELDEPAGCLAAKEAVDNWKEKNHLNPSTVWNLTS